MAIREEPQGGVGTGHRVGPVRYVPRVAKDAWYGSLCEAVGRLDGLARDE